MPPAEGNLPLLRACAGAAAPKGWVCHVMKCPYCAEEIKDEAVFCHHCRHDFGLVKPLMARLILLERKVDDFCVATVIASSTGQAASFLIFAATVAIVLCVVLTSGYFVVGQGGAPPYVLAIALPPAVLGLMIGIVASRRSAATFLISGFTLGTLNFLLIALMLGTVKGVQFQWPLAFATLVIGQAFTFATASFLGNSLRRSGWSLFKRLSTGDLVSKTKQLTDAFKSLMALASTIGLAYRWISEALP